MFNPDDSPLVSDDLDTVNDLVSAATSVLKEGENGGSPSAGIGGAKLNYHPAMVSPVWSYSLGRFIFSRRLPEGMCDFLWLCGPFW